MNDKLAEKRRKLDEAQARKLAGLDVDNSELGSLEDNIPAGAVVTKHGDVVVNNTEVDPAETNAMGQPALTNPEGNTSDVNRDTDTDGDADGNPDTHGHQGIDRGVVPQTTDPRVNPDGTNNLYTRGPGDMPVYDPADPNTSKQVLPAGSPTHTIVAPTQADGQLPGNTGLPGTAESEQTNNAASPRVSARVEAELQRGRELVSQKQQDSDDRRREAEIATQRNTVVTDASDDPDGEKGRKTADKKASAKSENKSKK